MWIRLFLLFCLMTGLIHADFHPKDCRKSKESIHEVCLQQLSKKAMRTTTRKWNIRNRTDLEITNISRMYNPIIRGWFTYYGKFCPSQLYQFCRHFNKALVSWAMRKYKNLRGKTRAGEFIEGIAKKNPQLFVHWERGMIGGFLP